MFRQLNLFLAFLTVMLIISPLAQARGRDGLHHRKETRGKRHQPKRAKGRRHSELTAEQRDAIKSKVTQLKAAEASRRKSDNLWAKCCQVLALILPKGKAKEQAKGESHLTN